MRYVFGPVPSRRLGFSLGIDMVPYKTCTFDCVYCECGKTTVHETTRRQHFESIGPVLDEIEMVLSSGRRIDYITLGGSGEPTLNVQCGELIKEVKARTDIPVAVLTNGSLMPDEKVFRELLLADLVIPSLDASLQEPFETVNRPVSGILAAEVADAISRFVRASRGQMWLEVLIVAGMNDADEHIEALADTIRHIDPLHVQVGTVERPGTEDWAEPVSEPRLAQICSTLGPRAVMIGGPSRDLAGDSTENMTERLLALITRRPCTIDDIESAVGGKRPVLLGKLEELKHAGKVNRFEHKDKTFYIGSRE
ncbi:radical SAM protein [bacterium]|nr:radical SAM protein [bacterium]